MSKLRLSQCAPRLRALRSHRVALLASAVLAALLAGCGKAPQTDPERTASAIQPVARVEIQAATVEAGKRSGVEVYKSLCTSCHAVGALEAPRTGNAEDWAPRLAKGLEANVASAINGLGVMPPRGGGADLTDTEVERAVVYLLNQAGGNFTEPPIE